MRRHCFAESRKRQGKDLDPFFGSGARVEKARQHEGAACQERGFARCRRPAPGGKEVLELFFEALKRLPLGSAG
jgi:hypothetical protein